MGGRQNAAHGRASRAKGNSGRGDSAVAGCLSGTRKDVCPSSIDGCPVLVTRVLRVQAAGGILFLASPLASYITGHTLEVTGGMGI